MKSLKPYLTTMTGLLIGLFSFVPMASAADPTSTEREHEAQSVRAIPARMIKAPRAQAVKRKLPVPVKVRVPKGTTELTVRVNRHNVSKRFRRGGQTRAAKLGRAQGLRYGTNQIYVLAKRGKSRPLASARTFYLIRPVRNLATLRVLPRKAGAAVRVSLKASRPPLPPAGELGQSGLVAGRLKAMHEKRTVKLWLNGKRVNKAVSSSQLTRWLADLSATHGLRYGINRLQATVVEPETGRFKTMRRTFRINRNRPLAAAGWDRYSREGSVIRFNGRRSLRPGKGRLRFKWTVASKPKGSTASLRRPGRAQPRLKVDRPGTYVIQLAVSSRSGRKGHRARRTGTDRVTVTVAPHGLLVPFTGLATGSAIPSGSTPGIKVGDSFYPKPADGQFQWLTLDRSTLAPRGPNANNWVDQGATDEHSFEGLYKSLKQMGHDQLVVLTKPLGDPGKTPVTRDHVDLFNNILNLLGVASIPADQLTAGSQQLVVVGVPYAGPGSGWSSQAFGGRFTVLNGWLMPDAAPAANGDLNFRFQPERIKFDTRASSTATSNTMEIGDSTLPATLPDGSSGGFQVVAINPVTFEAGESRVFSTNSGGVGGSPLGGRRAMSDHLKSLESMGMTFAVQSIGKVGDFTRPDGEDQFKYDMHNAWMGISRELSLSGANPDLFNTTTGSYAFLGGKHLDRSQVADSSSGVVINPTTNPPLTEAGVLSGRATVTSNGSMEPVIATPVNSTDQNLYDKIFMKPTPWPLTGSGPHAAAYSDALTYISRSLNAGDNIRDLYWKSLEKVYSDEINQLRNIPYPGSSWTCSRQLSSTGGGASDSEAASFSREQFCQMSAQLAQEFRLLDRVKQMFDAYQMAFSRSGPVQQADLQSMDKAIEDALKPNEAEEILWSVGGFVGNLISAGLVLAPGGGEVLAAWEALVSVYELTREMTGETGGVPVGDQVKSKAGDIGIDLAKKLDASSDGVDRLRQVIASDWGRLKAVGTVAGTPGWSVDIPTVKANLTNSAQVFFSSELMPIPYGVHYLADSGFNHNPTADNCYTMAYGHTYRGAPDTAKINWMGQFTFQRVSGGPNAPMVLAVHSPSVLRYSYPPAEITDQMFLPRVRGGFGMQLSRYIWEAYSGSDGEDPPGFSPPTYIAYCH